MILSSEKLIIFEKQKSKACIVPQQANNSNSKRPIISTVPSFQSAFEYKMAFESKMAVAALGNLVCIILCGFALGLYYLFLALLAKYFKETNMNEFQSAFEYKMALAAWGNLVCSLLCGFALGLYYLFLALLAKYMEMKSASRNHSTDRTTTSPGPTSPRHCTGTNLDDNVTCITLFLLLNPSQRPPNKRQFYAKTWYTILRTSATRRI